MKGNNVCLLEATLFGIGGTLCLVCPPPHPLIALRPTRGSWGKWRAQPEAVWGLLVPWRRNPGQWLAGEGMESNAIPRRLSGSLFSSPCYGGTVDDVSKQ